MSGFVYFMAGMMTTPLAIGLVAYIEGLIRGRKRGTVDSLHEERLLGSIQELEARISKLEYNR